MHRLRNTYIIFTSDNGFFYGQHRLIGGKFLAYEPSTHLPLIIRGPGIKPGTPDRRAGGQHRHRADDPRTRRRSTADKSIDGPSLVPYMIDPSLRTRRPLLFESFVETNDVEENGGGPPPGQVAAGRPAAGPASTSAPPAGPAPRSSRRPRTTTGSASAPTSTSSGPTARKSSTTSPRTPTSSTTRSRDGNFAPIRAFLHAELERLETCVGRACSEVAEKLPLTKDQQLKVKRGKEKEQREREREQKRNRKNTTTSRDGGAPALSSARRSTQRNPMWLVELSSSRPGGRRAVAQAVAGRAEVRAALDHEATGPVRTRPPPSGGHAPCGGRAHAAPQSGGRGAGPSTVHSQTLPAASSGLPVRREARP